MRMKRGAFAAGAAVALAGLLAVTAGPAAAQNYPNRPVKVIVPFAASGPADIIARILGQKLSESLGQQFVVENRPGAGGNIGIAAVTKAAPDGYTLLVVSSAIVINPSLYAKVPYDLKDLAPITNAADSPNLLSVNPSVPAKTVKELIEVIRANPGKYSFSTAGMGTTPDLAGELFRMTYKLDMVRVPFNGAAPALASALQGQTPLAFTALPPATEMVKAGQLRALAVTAKQRSPALPDVPTMEEAGIPGQESDTLQGVFAPAATPRPIIDLLQRAIVKAMAQPDVKSRLVQLGFDPVGSTPDEFAAQIRVEYEKWGKVIRSAGIKVE